MADMPIAPGIIDRSGIAASGLRAMLSGYAARLRDRSKSLISFFDLQMENIKIKSELEKLRGENK